MNRFLCALPFVFGSALSVNTLLAEPIREGEGSRRQQLNAMELKAFPTDAWGKLSDAKFGTLVSANDIAGKPVLVVTWTSWLPTAERALSVARRAAETYAKDGLMVVVAHHPEGWDDPKAQGTGLKLADGAHLVIAHDAKGEFRQAILSDQDPDFYVIDRAGQLRFADVTTESVDEACRIVSAETLDQAAGVNTQLAEAAARRAAEAARTSTVRDAGSLASIPEQAFAEPAAAAYAGVRWPRNPGASEQPGEAAAARKVQLPAAGFFPSRPETKGRGIVIYFWNPRIRESYDPVMTRMDRLQKSGGRDLVVVGALSPLTTSNSTEEAAKKPDTDPLAFARARNLQHAVLADPAGALYAQVSGDQSQQPIPYAAVLSSDGTLRFNGSINNPAFQGAIDTILSDDPGVKARRAAEAEYLRSKGG